MEIINQIITTTLESFDIPFCIAVNVLTYITVKFLDDVNGYKKVNTWIKRLVLLICCVIVSTVYLATGSDAKLILNSAILAPVFWSWIGKPICTKLGVDYKKDTKDLDVDKF